jgi:hypothetical protein
LHSKNACTVLHQQGGNYLIFCVEIRIRKLQSIPYISDLNQKPNMSKSIKLQQATQALQGHQHQIPLDKAKKMAKKFQRFRNQLAKAKKEGGKVPEDSPEMANCFAFNKKDVLKVLKPTEAVGLRIYPGISDAAELTVVLVAFDAEGKNIDGETYPILLKSAKSGKPKKSGNGDDPNDGVLDDAQRCPPYTAPPTP